MVKLKWSGENHLFFALHVKPQKDKKKKKEQDIESTKEYDVSYYYCYLRVVVQTFYFILICLLDYVFLYSIELNINLY